MSFEQVDSRTPISKRTRRKKNSPFFPKFNSFIQHVLKSGINPDSSIAKNTLNQLNNLIVYIGQNIAETSYDLARIDGKKTISNRSVQTATLTLLPGMLAKHAVSEGTKAVTKYNSSPKTEARENSASKAGIIFSPPRAKKLFSLYKTRIGETAPVYLAAVLEYLCAEILELSDRVATDMKKVRINNRHLYIGIYNDDELKKLMNSMKIELSGGGVIPNIHESLLPGNKKYKKKTGARSGAEVPHRFRPGTVSLRNIRKAQKQSNCVNFPRLSFERLIREVGQNYKSDMKYSKESLLAIQTYIEQQLVKLLEEANLLAIHSNRKTVQPSDLQLVRRIHDNL